MRLLRAEPLHRARASTSPASPRHRPIFSLDAEEKRGRNFCHPVFLSSLRETEDELWEASAADGADADG